MAFDRAGPQTVQPPPRERTRDARTAAAAADPDDDDAPHPPGLTGCAGAPDGIEGGPTDASDLRED